MFSHADILAGISAISAVLALLLATLGHKEHRAVRTIILIFLVPLIGFTAYFIFIHVKASDLFNRTSESAQSNQPPVEASHTISQNPTADKTAEPGKSTAKAGQKLDSAAGDEVSGSPLDQRELELIGKWKCFSAFFTFRKDRTFDLTRIGTNSVATANWKMSPKADSFTTFSGTPFQSNTVKLSGPPLDRELPNEFELLTSAKDPPQGLWGNEPCDPAH
jgi:hypothetical protein